MFGLGHVLSTLLQLLHVLPPLVGLVVVARIRTTQRWRTFALTSFGLGVLLALASVGLSLGLAYAYRLGFPYTALGLVSTLLSLLSLAAAGLGVAAVVADRASDAPAPGPVAPYPTASVPPQG
ncbi:hypothetical protein [Phycicoccus sonneratiae]|uniref:Uncharacterized protein n=1 Tax=Phycicoccus sonneratiae TaxID=2807628 RepID=A0ABS2CL86_9MICO|nr:hypothetical protein [Phycicoccus sonneraticus]MBM6400560.1 hypothetical protein [Phycicoccus sonneraticus]